MHQTSVTQDPSACAMEAFSPARPAAAWQAAVAAVGSFTTCAATYSLARAVGHKVVPSWERLDKEQRVAFGANSVGLLHALVVSPPSLLAIYAILSSDAASQVCSAASAEDEAVSLLTVEAPQKLVIATGISCGYFIYDCVLMALSAEARASLGTSLCVCMWLHHVVSAIVWPYCVIVDRGAIFVAQLLTTELSNIGQNAYYVVGLMASVRPAVKTLVGVVWILVFAACRIVPIPWVAYAYDALLVTPGCGATAVERSVGLVTVPIPTLLNLWWFYLLLKGAWEALKGDDSSAQPASSSKDLV